MSIRQQTLQHESLKNTIWASDKMLFLSQGLSQAWLAGMQLKSTTKLKRYQFTTKHGISHQKKTLRPTIFLLYTKSRSWIKRFTFHIKF